MASPPADIDTNDTIDEPAGNAPLREKCLIDSPVRSSKAQSADEQVNPLTEFVTTSHVIESINSALNDVMKQDAMMANNNSDEKRSFFELQKKMPDGSSRKATAEEMSAHDMKNKLEQAAHLTSQMTAEQKMEWTQKQRQQGNQLYQEAKYKEAIDIYLTCLVARDTNQQSEKDQQVVILPVMNNLAQCALQLGWYHKAEVFCTLAMESLQEDSIGQAVAKLYYKRGKARRLRGIYDLAKKDLEQALTKLDGVSDNPNDKSLEQKAIEKEFQLLEKAIAEGKKNKKRAQRAMQKVLGSQTSDATTDVNNSMNATTNAATQQSAPFNAKIRIEKAKIPTADTTTPLYHEKQTRTHSTIRKRQEGPPPYERPRLPPQLSYWQMYRLIAARVAQRILDLIGEEEGTGFGASASSSSETAATGTHNRPKED
jgi:tetratricopeptide (TPR) repeat protein